MIVRKRVGPALLAGAALSLSLGAIVSCSKQPTGVDASFTQPEGTVSGASQLLVWPAIPVHSIAFTDVAPVDPGPEDIFLGTRTYNAAPEGSVLGMVLDGTAATGYQMMRREPNGGLRSLSDFVFQPTFRWLDSHWELYQFSDERPYDAGTYLGRGVIAGVVTENSPISNEALIENPPIPDLPVHFTNDSTGTWDAVPGADHYMVHVFQLRQATPLERILASAPAPFYRGKSLDTFLGMSTTPQIVKLTTHFVGSAHPLPDFVGTVLTRRNLIPGSAYLLRVTAIGPRGQLIAFSYGDSDLVAAEGEYERYAQGSFVMPRPRPEAPSRIGLVARGAGRP